MKNLLVLLCPFVLIGCSTSSMVTMADGTTVKSAGRFGGQGVMTVESGGSKVMVADNNEESFRELAKTVRFGIGVDGLKSITSSISGAYKSVTNAKTSADITKNGLTEATNQVGLQEITKQKALEIPIAQ
jgi:hypothetical protein